MTVGFYDDETLWLQDEEMSWLDKSCLHLAVRKKDKIETVTFQVGQQSLITWFPRCWPKLSPDYFVIVDAESLS